MYLNGEGTSKNISLAAEWLAKSANNNNVEAANELGDLYYSSIIKPIDNSHSWDKAMRLYWIGEKVNDPHALFKLGCIDLFLFKNNNNAEKHFEEQPKQVDLITSGILPKCTYIQLGKPYRWMIIKDMKQL